MMAGAELFMVTVVVGVPVSYLACRFLKEGGWSYLLAWGATGLISFGIGASTGPDFPAQVGDKEGGLWLAVYAALAFTTAFFSLFSCSLSFFFFRGHRL